MKRVKVKVFLESCSTKIKLCRIYLLISILFLIPTIYSSETLKTSALNGNINSQFRLGFFYSKGTHKNLLEAQYWMKMSANGGNPLACCYLGHINLHRKDVKNSLALAKKWFLLAVRNGDSRSLVGLAKCYELERDWTDSLAWYKIAYEMGDNTVGDSIIRISKFLNDTEKELMPNLILESKELISSLPTQAIKIQTIEKNKVVRLQMKDGDSYWGEAINKTPHGYGRTTSIDGTSYQGEFKNGTVHGYGISFNKAGIIIYEGLWENGKPTFEKSGQYND
jgi:TPR repeat protein